MQSSAAPEPKRDLSPRTQELLATVRDAGLRREVEAVARAAVDALAALGRIHLPQDQFEESPADGRGDLAADKHLELAPYVLAALAAINRLTELVTSTFPAPASVGEPSVDDFELEFDLVDGPTGEGERLSSRKSPAAAQLSQREQVAEVAYALATMLASRVASFAPRLRRVVGESDAWALLAELDDSKRSLTKGVQGLLFSVLGVFQETARREEILPEYRSAVRESVDLRAALTDLGYHVGRFNNAMSGAQPAELLPLLVGVADRLGRFSARPEYRTMRAEDKRAVIDFRRLLFSLRHAKGGVPVLQLRQAVEGFSKFLEAMQAINHREVLVIHDQQRLGEALERLEESLNLAIIDPPAARGRLQAIVRLLSSVLGRHPDLDQALRTFGATPAATQDLPVELERWRSLVRAALAAVG